MLARGQVGEQGGEGIQAFGFHGFRDSCENPGLYRMGAPAAARPSRSRRGQRTGAADAGTVAGLFKPYADANADGP